MKGDTMKITKMILLAFVLLATHTSAETLYCKDIYTVITSEKGKGPSNYTSDGGYAKGKHTYLKLNLNTDGIEMITGKGRTQLHYMSRGISGDTYFYEKTNGGNINLYALHSDGTMTVSKSYFWNLMKEFHMNVQTIYQCGR